MRDWLTKSLCTCEYAYDYEPQYCWSNAQNPIVWDEIAHYFSMHNVFYIMHRLAKAKILQSLLDLCDDVHISNAAFNWIFSDQSDFRAFCSDAGMSVKIVRHKAKDIIDNGLKWRRSPGDGDRYQEKRQYRQFKKFAA